MNDENVPQQTPVEVPAAGLPKAEMAKLVEAAPQPQATPEQIAQRVSNFREGLWGGMVNRTRDEIAKRRGCKPENVELLGDSPAYRVKAEGEEGPGYSKLALDAHGMYAVGRPRGRRTPRIGPMGGMVKQMSMFIFERLFADSLAEAKAKHAAETPEAEFKGLSKEETANIGKLAANVAIKYYRQAQRIGKREAKRRQAQARRQNFGLLAGNRARRTYSGRD